LDVSPRLEIKLTEEKDVGKVRRKPWLRMPQGGPKCSMQGIQSEWRAPPSDSYLQPIK